jgi:hypothetical protein
MPIGDEEVVAGGADGLEPSASAPHGGVVGGQIGALGPCGGLRGLGQHGFSHTEPCRVRPGRRLPPEALLPGQIPAHDARSAGVGKTLMSTPISAINPMAVLRATPGIVTSRSITGSCTVIADSILASIAATDRHS